MYGFSIVNGEGTIGKQFYAEIIQGGKFVGKISSWMNEGRQVVRIRVDGTVRLEWVSSRGYPIGMDALYLLTEKALEGSEVDQVSYDLTQTPGLRLGPGI